MRPTLTTKIGLLLLLPFLGSLAGTLVVTSYLQRARTTDHVVNVAGRQRLLAAELRDWASMVALGQEEDRAGLRSRVAEFEHGLVALQRGGQVWDGVVDAAPPDLKPELAAVASLWNQLRPDLLTIAEASRQEARFVAAYQRVENRLPQLRDLAHRFVTAFVARHQRERREMLWTLGFIAVGNLAVLLTGLFLTRRYIVRPIVGLETAARRMQAGDFAHRLDASGRDELGTLARTFNAMVEQVEQLLAALDLRRKHAEIIVASVSSWLLVLRQDLTVLQVNRSFREAFGPDEGAVGQPVTALLPAPGLREAALEVLASGKPQCGLQLEMPWQGGTRSLRVMITGTHLAEEEEEEEEEELLVAVEDVTEYKRAERQSESERSVLELLAKGEALPSVLTRLALSYEAMYPGVLCSVLLLDAEGKHLTHGAAPSLPAAYCQAIDGIEIGPSAGSCGTAAYTGQRTMVADIASDPLWRDYKHLALAHGLFACSSVPILSTQGRVLGTFAFYSSTPRAVRPDEPAAIEKWAYLASLAIERQQREAALRRSEADLRGLIERAVFGIYRSTPDGRLLMVNRALVEMLGYDAAEEVLAVGTVALYQRPDERSRVLAHYAAHDAFTGMEAGWKRKDDTPITVRLSGRPVRELGGELVTFEVFVEDVTERVVLEDYLRQSQKMQAVGKLAGVIAHDFNNLLTAILVSSELMGSELPADSPIGENLGMIRSAALRAAELTRKLLGFSRRQHLELRPVDLGAVVTDFGRMMRRLIHEDIDVQVIVEEAKLGALADPGAVEQILMNLMTNARDATPPGGTVRVKVHRAVLDEAYRKGRGWGTTGEYVAIEVSDTGAGMDEETRQRIFEPFFTTKPEGKGTGLGMAMVYGLVKQHDGYVDVSSALGRGTTVSVFLPAVAEELSERPAVAAPPPGRGGETILLLVEDEEAVRRLAQRVLEEYGYTVLAAVNGAEAHATFEAHRGAIALVISDVVMPVMGGPELYRTLRQAGHRVRFLFTSGYMAREGEGTATIAPGVPFLSKPWQVTDFLGKVRMVLDASV